MNQHLNFNFNCQEGSQVFNYNLSNNKQKYCVFTAAISGLLIYKSNLFLECQPSTSLPPPPDWQSLLKKGIIGPDPGSVTLFLTSKHCFYKLNILTLPTLLTFWSMNTSIPERTRTNQNNFKVVQIWVFYPSPFPNQKE